ARAVHIIHAVGDCDAKVFAKVFGVFLLSVITNPAVNRSGPIALDTKMIGADREKMRGRQSLNILKCRSRLVAIQAKKQEICNSLIVQLVGNARVLADAIESIAAQKEV